MYATASHRRAQCSILYSENYKIVENREIYGYSRQCQFSYIDSLCVMVVALVTVTILTLVRGNMALYHRHIKVYTCFHLFWKLFWTDFWFCVMFWDAFTKGQVTEADNNTEDQKPGN